MFLNWKGNNFEYDGICVFRYPKRHFKTGENTKILGQICDSTLAIYIYIYAVESKTGPRFGVSSVKSWSKSSVKNWSKFFTAFPIFIVLFGVFLKTQIVSHCAKIVVLQNFGDVKNDFEKKIAFFVFVFFMLEK